MTTFLNDLWKKMKVEGSAAHTKPSTTEKAPAEVKDLTSAAPISAKPEPPPANNINAVLNSFEHTEIESLQRDSVLTNLKTLKGLVDEPKEEKPELRFSKIKQHLGEPESHETVRQERWSEEIRCPNCKSVNLRQLPQIPPTSAHNHRYRCLECSHTFNDDSDTPFDKGVPPLNIWMQCWYLMGCTDSLNYISAKLNLDLSLIEYMAQQLKKLFNSQKPLTKFLGFEEWNKQSQHLRDQLKEDLMKQYERLNANVATAPKDTAEFRRQQNIRRGLSPSQPPSPTMGKKR